MTMCIILSQLESCNFSPCWLFWVLDRNNDMKRSMYLRRSPIACKYNSHKTKMRGWISLNHSEWMSPYYCELFKLDIIQKRGCVFVQLWMSPKKFLWVLLWMQCDISGCTGLWVIYCLDELLHLFIGYSCVPGSQICVNSCVQKMSFYLSHLVSPLESCALSKL